MEANKGGGLQMIDSYSSGYPVFHSKNRVPCVRKKGLGSARVDWQDNKREGGDEGNCSQRNTR